MRMEHKADVVVVGLGAVGSAVLYQLGDRDIDVIGIEVCAAARQRLK